MKKYTLHEDKEHISTHIDFKGNLNEQQYDVVTKAEGPCLVLAGAGSGKTRTLIYRLAYLIERGVKPHNILLMTFTNKAAREMKERTEELLKYSPRGLWSGTFHHTGNRSLRIYANQIGYERDFGILDEPDSKDLVKACIKKVCGKTKNEKFPKPAVIKTIISLSENTKKPVKDILEDIYPYFMDFGYEIEEIKKLYGKKKKESNNMDYDDLLSKWKLILEKVPEARERFTDQFHYIMVDEYQDTNSIQADIIDILGERHLNILAVGDDAQSIYSFRGATVENILNFPKKFKDSKIFKMETNYRSNPEILDLANDSLENNTNQFYKELKAVKPSAEVPALVEVSDHYMQARFIAQRIRELREEGMRINDIAVLFRAHYQSAELEMELVKRGVPYVVRGGIRFFEQAHIKDALSFLKIIVNPTDVVAWIRALTLCEGIGPGYAEKAYEFFKNSGMDIATFIKAGVPKVLSQKAQGGYLKFKRIMESLVDEDIKECTGDMIEAVLDKGYETHAQANFDNAKDRVDDIHELVNFSHGYENVNDFLSDITLRENFKGETAASVEDNEDQLILSTIHQAKGLEWETVFVIGLCEGQFPHAKSYGDDAQIEEERRLFYVAVTRAKKYLHLMHPMTRYDFKQGTVIAKRSRFLEELNSSSYEVWQTETQSRFDEYRGDENIIEM